MTTIKLAVLKHTKAKDGSYKIRISIGHKSETHYIVTKYKVTSLSHFVNGQVVGQPDAAAINLKLRQLLTDYDNRLDRVLSPNQYTCEQLRDILQNMQPVQNDMTFATYTRLSIDELRKDGRETTAIMREYQLKKFLEFTGGDVFLSEITPRLIADYSRWFRRQKASDSLESINMTMVKTVVNKAIKEGIIKYDVHPFAYYSTITPEPRELDIPVSDIILIRDYQTPFKGEQKARDLFILSYYLGGINLIDLMAYDFRNKQTMEYIRIKTRNKKKTNRTISFTIPPEAFPLIKRHMNAETGHLDFGTKGSYDTFKNIVTRDIKRVAHKAGVEQWQRVCFYTARKSFVQHGFDLGISLETLEYCIGQSMKSGRPIFNYLKIMRRHADTAIRTILDNLASPPTTQEDEEGKDSKGNGSK
jgi:hypothetical protein